jgi:hypothetical protein
VDAGGTRDFERAGKLLAQARSKKMAVGVDHK